MATFNFLKVPVFVLCHWLILKFILCGISILLREYQLPLALRFLFFGFNRSSRGCNWFRDLVPLGLSGWYLFYLAICFNLRLSY
jgi:hypothetical protein